MVITFYEYQLFYFPDPFYNPKSYLQVLIYQKLRKVFDNHLLLRHGQEQPLFVFPEKDFCKAALYSC